MPNEADTEFGDPAQYPYMTVASPSCHDTSTSRAWYEEDTQRRDRFCSDVRCLTTPRVQGDQSSPSLHNIRHAAFDLALSSFT